MHSEITGIVPLIGSGFFGCFTRCAFAAAFPLFGTQMYERLGYQWASTLLAFLTLIMAPFPYLFFQYGKILRKNSGYTK
ncbi:hypothetical protein F4778DRAFT_475407 [Xylariomycetidae sp. FL2044]|nr:hypothetical protein F4778DRAFT_475407 [Xylariomycetidae sp. FL2044]